MWTYLAILLSLGLLTGIFIRRYVVFSRGPTSEATHTHTEDEESVTKKLRLSKDDQHKAQSLSKKGDTLIKAGKDDEAIKCFVQALAIDALHQETQYKLAVLYLQKQMYGAAAALFRQLAEISPDPVHYSHLGLALYNQSDFENALGAYQKAVDLDPSRPQRFVSLAQVYRAMGRLQHAVIALQKAVELECENMDFLFLLADVQMEMKNYVSALEILAQVLEIDPKNKAANTMIKEIAELQMDGG